MSKKITNDQSKIDLVARLVKEGTIDFVEALQLLEVEIELQYIPYQYPNYPLYPTWDTTPILTTSYADTKGVFELN